MSAEADPTGAAAEAVSSAVEDAIRRLVAYGSQRGQLAFDAAASPQAAGSLGDTLGNSTPGNGQASSATPPPLPPGEGWGEGSPPNTRRSLRQPTVSAYSANDRNAGDSQSSPSSTGGRTGDAAPARFESLEGLYHRIAASAAGGGPDDQSSKANVETARNTSLILQALEAQNKLLESSKSQQPQQVLWQ
jgi:hypothetical protein